MSQTGIDCKVKTCRKNNKCKLQYTEGIRSVLLSINQYQNQSQNKKRLKKKIGTLNDTGSVSICTFSYKLKKTSRIGKVIIK